MDDDLKIKYLIYLINDILIKYNLIDISITFTHNEFFEQYRFELTFKTIQNDKDLFFSLEDDIEKKLSFELNDKSVYSNFKYKRKKLRIDIEDDAIPTFDYRGKIQFRDQRLKKLLDND